MQLKCSELNNNDLTQQKLFNFYELYLKSIQQNEVHIKFQIEEKEELFEFDKITIKYSYQKQISNVQHLIISEFTDNQFRLSEATVCDDSDDKQLTIQFQQSDCYSIPWLLTSYQIADNSNLDETQKVNRCIGFPIHSGVIQPDDFTLDQIKRQYTDMFKYFSDCFLIALQSNQFHQIRLYFVNQTIQVKQHTVFSQEFNVDISNEVDSDDILKQYSKKLDYVRTEYILYDNVTKPLYIEGSQDEAQFYLLNDAVMNFNSKYEQFSNNYLISQTQVLNNLLQHLFHFQLNINLNSQKLMSDKFKFTVVKNEMQNRSIDFGVVQKTKQSFKTHQKSDLKKRNVIFSDLIQLSKSAILKMRNKYYLLLFCSEEERSAFYVIQNVFMKRAFILNQNKVQNRNLINKLICYKQIIKSINNYTSIEIENHSKTEIIVIKSFSQFNDFKNEILKNDNFVSLKNQFRSVEINDFWPGSIDFQQSQNYKDPILQIFRFFSQKNFQIQFQIHTFKIALEKRSSLLLKQQFNCFFKNSVNDFLQNKIIIQSSFQINIESDISRIEVNIEQLFEDYKVLGTEKGFIIVVGNYIFDVYFQPDYNGYLEGQILLNLLNSQFQKIYKK